MKTFKMILAALAASAMVAAESPEWSVCVESSGGVTGGGKAQLIRSNGDIITETWPSAAGNHTREVTGYVNRDQLEILERMLKDPQLVKQQVSKKSNENRVLRFTYGEVKKTYTVPSGARFPELVERLSNEVERALRAAKQG